MDDKRALLRHYLAAIAYRTQKALCNMPADFGSFSAGLKVRTPNELVRHMDSVLGYARALIVGSSYRPPEFADFDATIKHFHQTLGDLGSEFSVGTDFRDITAEALLQGPLSDAMTHAGQLAMLRRLAGSPVPPENFVFAGISPDNLGPQQPLPAKPDTNWPERL